MSESERRRKKRGEKLSEKWVKLSYFFTLLICEYTVVLVLVPVPRVKFDHTEQNTSGERHTNSKWSHGEWERGEEEEDEEEELTSERKGFILLYSAFQQFTLSNGIRAEWVHPANLSTYLALVIFL